MKLDDFESVFRSAVKDPFKFEAPTLGSVLVVTDQQAEGAATLTSKLQKFIRAIHGPDLEWHTVSRGDFANVHDIIDRVERIAPDLIACHRHLLGQGRGLTHSLGSTVDTLTQALLTPVLLIPDPDSPGLDQRLDRLERVLVIADHLTGDDQLVNWGVHMCPENGVLYLAHVEDDETYRRYVDVLSKLPGIETESAAEKIHDKLLAMPRDYIESIATVLSNEGVHEQIEPIVTMGHALSDYKKLIEDSDIDLLVFNTNDEQQLAMHGMAYALSVEIRSHPLLLV